MPPPSTITAISIFIVALLSIANICTGLVHDLSIVDDDRSLFKIETFGFFAGGKVKLILFCTFSYCIQSTFNLRLFRRDAHKCKRL
jgi:hypothetical protein